MSISKTIRTVQMKDKLVLEAKSQTNVKQIIMKEMNRDKTDKNIEK